MEKKSISPQLKYKKIKSVKLPFHLPKVLIRSD